MSEPPRQMLQVVPILKPEAWTATDFLCGHVLPWGVPSLLGVAGHPEDDRDAREIIVAYEWPVPALEVDARLGREAIESWHFHRFLTDETIRTGQPPYTNIQRGDDPPDFTANWNGARVAVDCARLSTEPGLQAQARFGRLRQAILDLPRERLAHLAGHHIYVWFPTTEGHGLPAKDATAMGEVAQALANHTIETTWLEYPAPKGDRPPVLNEFVFDERSEIAHFYAFPMSVAVPTTTFFTETGFELGLALSTRLSITGAWEECKRIISQHDQPSIDHLVLTVGGPSETGLSFPSEQFVFGDALPRVDADSIECAHLQRVVVHNVLNGEVIQLAPEPGRWAPMYPGGLVPAFLAREPRPFPQAEIEQTDATAQ